MTIKFLSDDVGPAPALSRLRRRAPAHLASNASHVNSLGYNRSAPPRPARAMTLRRPSVDTEGIIGAVHGRAAPAAAGAAREDKKKKLVFYFDVAFVDGADDDPLRPRGNITSPDV
ncbi:hypothetical protein EVAR_54393_1 [Eumeta japonica]|uniref:Uncharacterized protein n=1 Tax=Eumeta variegata TaxID=151549 RepID=A0A4C1Y5G4_EUMVA|nr:hypothetical protein EVAR_54393_1 [Eumeta japonica]